MFQFEYSALVILSPAKLGNGAGFSVTFERGEKPSILKIVPSLGVIAKRKTTLTKISTIFRTYKLYYGGAQKRPDGMYSAPVVDAKGQVVAHVSDSNRKDVRYIKQMGQFKSDVKSSLNQPVNKLTEEIKP